MWTADLSDDEIKRHAVHIPFELLQNDPDEFVGQIIRFEGQIVQVARSGSEDAYVLRIAMTSEPFAATDAVWSNYKAATQEERYWLDSLQRANNPFAPPTPENTVMVYGMFTGHREYENIFQATVTAPEVDVFIMEKGGMAFADPGPGILGPGLSLSFPPGQNPDQVFPHDGPDNGAAVASGHADNALPDQQADGGPDHPSLFPREKSLHTVYYRDIPDYADGQTVQAALYGAIQEWEEANPGVGFELVDHGADLDLYWVRWMPGSQLGQYVARTTADYESTMHRINIRLGSDDCHSEYQQYSLESLRHTITHEIGHYLGLRHIDDETHLMYSDELFNVDSASVYDDQGYNIPELAKPTVISDKGKSIQSQIDMVNEEVERVLHERQIIKSAHGEESSSAWESALQDNTLAHNALVAELDELGKDLDCLGNTRF